MKWHWRSQLVRSCALLLGGAVFAACGQDSTAPEPSEAGPFTVAATDLLMAHVPEHYEALLSRVQSAGSATEAIDLINEQLAADGLSLGLEKIEWINGPDAMAAGQTVIRNDRTLRLPFQWVPGDPRRLADGDNITHLVFDLLADANFGTPFRVDGEPAIDAAFDTWNDVQCSKLSIVKRPDLGILPSAIFGGNPFLADISTLGFLPGFFFDLVLFPGASNNVLGVTFTFIWLDGPGGDPTDVDNNGRLDTALKEIWYNDDFLWSATGSGGVDIETVALHENGHALELGHFGRIAVGNRNGKLHVSPRSVMNAIILSVLREPLGTDNAAYCGNFASWPN